MCDNFKKEAFYVEKIEDLSNQFLWKIKDNMVNVRVDVPEPEWSF